MGLQPYTIPTFTGTGSPILDGDGAGISISNRFSENVEGTLFWIRPGNDNASEETGKRLLMMRWISSASRSPYRLKE